MFNNPFGMGVISSSGIAGPSNVLTSTPFGVFASSSSVGGSTFSAISLKAMENIQVKDNSIASTAFASISLRPQLQVFSSYPELSMGRAVVSSLTLPVVLQSFSQLAGNSIGFTSIASISLIINLFSVNLTPDNGVGSSTFRSIAYLGGVHARFLGPNNSISILDTYGRAFSRTGSAKISTANYKFPTSSLYLSGSPDSVYLDTPGISLSNSDYTVASWVYVDRDAWEGLGDTWFSTYYDQSYGRINCMLQSGRLVFDEQDSNGNNDYFILTPPGSISLKTWYYLEVTRVGNSMLAFINGVLSATGTYPVRSGFKSFLRLGALDPANPPYDIYFKGYIQDFFLTPNNLHTSNYTPPTGFI